MWNVNAPLANVFLESQLKFLWLDNTLVSGINILTPMFIYFWNFFQGLRSHYGLKKLKFYYISLHILRGYSFCQIFQRLCLFKGLRLFWTLEYKITIETLIINLWYKKKVYGSKTGLNISSQRQFFKAF